MRNKKMWFYALTLLIAISIAGFFLPSTDFGETHENLVAGDVAWMLTSTALVLLMTPGLAFFYGGMVDPRNIISTILQALSPWGS